MQDWSCLLEQNVRGGYETSFRDKYTFIEIPALPENSLGGYFTPLSVSFQIQKMGLIIIAFFTEPGL